MFKNRADDGSLNICGKKIYALRKSKNMSQRQLADQMQLLSIDLTKNAIQQIESGQRFVIDIELKGFCQFFEISVNDLLGE